MLYPDLSELLSYRAKVNNLNLSSAYASKNIDTGGVNSIFVGQGLEFDSVRKYCYGDDVRHIDWKVTARTNKAYIKTYHKETLQNIMLVIDTNKYMQYGTKATFKSVRAAQVASIIGFMALKNHDKIGAVLFGGEHNIEIFKPGVGSGFYRILEQLTQPKQHSHEISTGSALLNLINSPLNYDICVVISDFIDIDKVFEKNLYFLSKKSKVVLISINDLSDYKLPNIGEIEFAENKQSFTVNTNDKAAAENYTKLWQENRDNLSKSANIAKANLIQLLTQDDPLSNIYAFFSRRGRCHQS